MKVHSFVTVVINSRALDKIPLSVHKVSKISKNQADFLLSIFQDKFSQMNYSYPLSCLDLGNEGAETR